MVEHASTRRWLLVVGFLLLAVNLRPALTTLPPVLDQVQRNFGISSGVAGLLTTAPVLCFALISPLAALLARRVGLQHALTLFLLLVLAGSMIRGIGTPTLFLGTVLVGAGIGLANVLLPAVVKQHFAARAALMTGLYMMFMGVGAALGAAATVPLERATGWPAATAAWGGLCVVALVFWAARREPARQPIPEPARVHGIRILVRSPLAWQLTLFMGLQSLGFYCILTWLPSLLVDQGIGPGHAGLLLALANLCGIPASLAVPLISHRLRSQRALAIGLGLLGGIPLTGLMIAPLAAPYLWVVLLGLAQGGAISLALTLVILRAASIQQAAELSGMVQGCGYALAASGPFVVGVLHDQSGGWVVPLGFLLACLAAQACFGALAGRPRHIAG
ncbi:MAG: CynX/NimT family MFS transporter [Haloechinothrix sp.]